MACGLHAGWNVFVGMVWSLPVSGYRFDAALLETESASSSLVSGGSFGAEGSWPGITVLLVLGFLTWRLPRARREERAGVETDDRDRTREFQG